MQDQTEISQIILYHREFRTALFLSSLTLGTFLFTMKTFIIQTMKKEVYDTIDYQDVIRYRRTQGQDITYYGSLRNFSRLILAAIITAILSALAQITLGYFETEAIAWICMISAGTSWLLVALVLFHVSANLSKMLDYAERVAVDKPNSATKTEEGGYTDFTE